VYRISIGEAGQPAPTSRRGDRIERNHEPPTAPAGEEISRLRCPGD
jgi:hypothetical protein